jgi:hypothetical protein
MIDTYWPTPKPATKGAAGFAISPELKRLVDPRRGPSLSPMFVAILGYLIGEARSRPEIVEMTITYDGFVMAREAGDIGFNAFIGSQADLWRNLQGWGHAAGLAPMAHKAWLAHCRTMIPQPSAQAPRREAVKA